MCAVVHRNDIPGGEFFLSINELVLWVLLAWQKPLGHFAAKGPFDDLGHILSEPCFEQWPEQISDRVFHRPIKTRFIR